MPTISKKQLEEYEQLKKDRDNGRLLTPDGLRFMMVRSSSPFPSNVQQITMTRKPLASICLTCWHGFKQRVIYDM